MNFSIFRWDTITGQPLVFLERDWEGEFELTVAEDLSTAHLIADLEVLDWLGPDGHSPRMVPMTIDLTWQAIEDREVGRHTEVVREPGLVSVLTIRGEWRNAVATGMLESLGENFSPTPTNIDAQISCSEQGTLTVTINRP